MDLNILWFILIAVLFTGFFFLEGFDYGVGMLVPFISDSEEDRTTVLQTIAPVWDGNEVWMITAGGAMFAAFPHVYATMFSGFYLALFLMLLALILRGTGLELRGKQDSLSAKRRWDWAICFGSGIPAFLWGVAVTNLLHGLPIDVQMHYQGTFFDLLSPYTIAGGLAFLLIFLFHGVTFLQLRLADQELLQKLHSWSLPLGVITAVVFIICTGMTCMYTDFLRSHGAIALLSLATVAFVGGCIALIKKTHAAFPPFIGSSLAIALTTAAFFTAMFPRLMISNLDPEYSLTIYNASSTPYTLTIMSIAAACLVPVVLIYQIWTYWIFRQRVSRKDVR